MALITEFHIGLSGKDMENQEIKPEDVIDSIKEVVDAGTFKEGKGLWKGETENTLIFEVADLRENSEFTAEELKKSLEKEFNQESIMVKRYGADAMF